MGSLAYMYSDLSDQNHLDVYFHVKNNWFHFCLWLPPAMRDAFTILVFRSSSESIASPTAGAPGLPFAGSLPSGEPLKLSEAYLPGLSDESSGWHACAIGSPSFLSWPKFPDSVVRHIISSVFSPVCLFTYLF